MMKKKEYIYIYIYIKLVIYKLVQVSYIYDMNIFHKFLTYFVSDVTETASRK